MSDSSITKGNKVKYQRFIQVVFNEGRFDTLSEFVSPNYILHDAPPGMPSGSDAIKEVVSMFRSAFPDLKITFDDLIAEGDLLAARSTLRGTHRGSIFGIPPTGKQVSVTALTMVRMLDGRVCESWVRNDVSGLMNQLQSVAG
jgi:steroid delta-isomerase-like uncharacterized protein